MIVEVVEAVTVAILISQIWDDLYRLQGILNTKVSDIDRIPMLLITPDKVSCGHIIICDSRHRVISEYV